LRHARQTGAPVALLYLDLDGFKEVNDRHGHAMGDVVLREVARRLQPQMRAGETLARLGGDEFAVVMRGGADAAAAEALAERIVAALREPVTLPGGARVAIGVSVGIAVQNAGEADADRLLEQADHALYRAKSQARRAWSVFGEKDGGAPLLPAAALEATAATHASRCEECGEGVAQPIPFSMAFQPIVDVVDRRVFAYEALVRGPQGEPAGTVLSRITRRNRYAFDQSCRRTAIELAARLGLVQTDALLSINFIPGAMYEPENCVRATLAAARRANLPGNRLIFEVTEGEQVLEPAHLARIFEVYRGHGFLPAIDDFGAGYAGLNLLARFQPSLIKLDRELIADIDASRPKQSIVRAVLAVCHDLGIRPIAEGVETTAEYRTLVAMGIRLFQGYLFARPAFEAFPTSAYPD
jgi:diguanylate cyclase (GGDEF)-like protein